MRGPGVWGNKKNAFFHFYSKKTSNIISKFNDDFSEDFFEVLPMISSKGAYINDVRF